MYRFSLLFILVFLLTCFNTSAQETDSIVLEHDSVITINGIKLATDIYLPNKKGAYPVILVRTPYKKEHWREGAIEYCKQGYAVVVQDCRGKYGSEGEFYGFGNERVDGLKTIEWIKKQSWFKDKISGLGGSYVGYTQWAIADQLDAICGNLTGANIYDLLYPQGLLSLESALGWGMAAASRSVNDIETEDMRKSLMHLPISTADDVTVKDIQFMNDWFSHEKEDAYWEKMNHRKTAKGAVMSMGGWYDIFVMAQIDDFVEIDKKNNHPENRLVIGPWSHGSQIYQNDFGGVEKTGNKGALQDRFLSKILLDKDVNVMEAPFTNSKYNFFIMERNQYYGTDSWPSKDVVNVDLFLDENKIQQNKPAKETQLHYIYDPNNPYPSYGGTNMGWMVGQAVQNDNNNRCDQWVFETEVLTDSITLLGNVGASLHISSNVETTDFIILVQDVLPNDTIINIQEGGKRVNLKKNKVNKIEIESLPTGYQLNPGHKLRITITSSWFPRYNRSLNTDTPIFNATETKQAINTIYLGGKYPSKITLPLLHPNKEKCLQ